MPGILSVLKVAQNIPASPCCACFAGGFELYDLVKDPYETKNIYSSAGKVRLAR